MKNKFIKITSLLVFFAIVLLGGAYYLKLSFSEGKIITPGSVESFLLVPDTLKDNSLLRIGAVQNYYYSAGDGPKPLITGVKILTTEDKEGVKNHIREYFLKNDFRENEKKELWSDQKEISISIENRSGDSLLVDIGLLEYYNTPTNSDNRTKTSYSNLVTISKKLERKNEQKKNHLQC